MRLANSMRGSAGNKRIDPWVIGPIPGLVAALLIFGLTQVVLIKAGLPALFDGALWDPDSYMWLNRVIHLQENGDWFDRTYPRLNPPLGFVQHWTRPIDVLLLLGAWPLGLLFGFEDALFWWSAIISPIFLVLTLVALMWAARPIMPRNMIWLIGLVFVCQPGVVAHFMSGRPDHHGLQLLLFVVLLGLTIRLLHQPGRDRLAVLSGLIGAFALWVSIQALPTVAVMVVALGLYWVLGERSLARTLLIQSCSLFAGLAIALAIERGTGHLFDVKHDTLSIVHLAIFGLNAGFWFGASVLENRIAAARRSVLSLRLTYGVLAAAGGAMSLWLFLPGLFQNPLMNVDELYLNAQLLRIRELRPLLIFGGTENWTWYWGVAKPMALLGIAILAIPWALYLMFTRQGPERRGWVAVSLLGAIWVPFSVYQIRWLSFADVALVFPYAAFGGALLAWFERQRLPVIAFTVGRPLLIACLCLWPAAALWQADSEGSGGGGETPVVTARNDCPIRPLSRFLSDPQGLGASPKRLLAFIDYGPELLYRTPHSLYTIPNHRLQTGFTLSYQVMTARDFTEGRRLLTEAGVQLVVICPGSAEEVVYAVESEEPTLYQAMSSNAAPDFLAPVSLPDELSGSFRLFSVRPGP